MINTINSGSGNIIKRKENAITNDEFILFLKNHKAISNMIDINDIGL
ncbi:hypothetical protein ACFL0W_00050 [Nanoarchaeota archaeon]